MTTFVEKIAVAAVGAAVTAVMGWVLNSATSNRAEPYYRGSSMPQTSYEAPRRVATGGATYGSGYSSFAADCDAHGGTITDVGGGRKHCHADAHWSVDR